MYAIANYLDKHNIQKPISAKKGWSHGTLNNILKNETYVGRWYYRKSMEFKDPKTGKIKRKRRPKKEWLMVAVPPIVSEKIFKAAQEHRQANKRRGKQRKNIYALGGRLKCGHCLNRMSGITRKDRGNKQYYVCNVRHGKGRYTSAQPCNSPYYIVSEIDNAIWQWLKSILLYPERLQKELEKFQEKQMSEFQPLLNMLKSSQEKLGELQDEKERLIKAYTSGVLGLDEIASQKTDLDKRINDLTQAIQELTVELKPKLLSKEEIQTIEDLAAQVWQGADLTDEDTETQREIFRLLQMEVTLSVEDGEQWADVSCILGQKHVPVAFKGNDFFAPSQA